MQRLERLFISIPGRVPGSQLTTRQHAQLASPQMPTIENTLCLVCPGCLTVLGGSLRKHPLGQPGFLCYREMEGQCDSENSSGNQGKHLYLVTLQQRQRVEEAHFREERRKWQRGSEPGPLNFSKASFPYPLIHCFLEAVSNSEVIEIKPWPKL